jgi:hypothetical protein
MLEWVMKCEICGQEATHRFSPDLDIDGLGGCDKHKESVQMAYYILINVGEKGYKSFLKSLQEKEKLTRGLSGQD